MGGLRVGVLLSTNSANSLSNKKYFPNQDILQIHRVELYHMKEGVVVRVVPVAVIFNLRVILGD